MTNPKGFGEGTPENKQHTDEWEEFDEVFGGKLGNYPPINENPAQVNNLKSQVCSLEWSKKLKALGVKQESVFYWRDFGRGEEIAFAPLRGAVIGKICAAFTASELGQKLEKASGKDRMKAYCEVMDIAPEHVIVDHALMNAMTQPDIPAAMLCYLIQNSLIKI